MTNAEIISEHIETMGIDFVYNGGNLLTFASWKKKGYSVIKGEKAFIKVDLWIMKKVKEENKETGEMEEVKKFFLRTTALFKADQIEKSKAKSKSKKAA